MQYLLALTFFIKKPKTGFVNVLLATLVIFIPIAGSMVLLGYRSYVAEDLDDDPELRYHRDFKFERFTQYLTRGIWPFLIQFMFSLVLIGGFYAALFGGMIYGQAGGVPPEYILLYILGLYVSLLVILILSSIFIYPMELYASLKRDFKFGEMLSFARTFAGMMWKETLISAICYTFLSMIVMFLGMMVFCVGMYPALTIISVGNAHILVQLYRVYVANGGEPLRERDPIERDAQPYTPDEE